MRRQPSIGGAPSPRPAPSLRPVRGGVRALMRGPGRAGLAMRRRGPPDRGSRPSRGAPDLPRVTLSRLRRLLGRRPRGHLLRVLAAAIACLALAAPAAASTSLSPPSLAGAPVLGSTLVGAPGAWSGSPDFASINIYRCTRARLRRRRASRVDGHRLPGDVRVHEAARARRLLPAGRGGARAGGRLVDERGERRRRPRAPPHPPAATAAPTLSPWPQDGVDATSTAGAWSNGGAPGEPAIALRWQRCDAAGNGCADVPGATAATYRPGPADVGRRLRVIATASNGGGSTVAASAPSDPVAPRNTLPPRSTAPRPTARRWPPTRAPGTAFRPPRPGVQRGSGARRPAPPARPSRARRGRPTPPGRRTSAPRCARSCARRRRGRPRRRHRQR